MNPTARSLATLMTALMLCLLATSAIADVFRPAYLELREAARRPLRRDVEGACAR